MKTFGKREDQTNRKRPGRHAKKKRPHAKRTKRYRGQGRV